MIVFRGIMYNMEKWYVGIGEVWWGVLSQREDKIFVSIMV